MPQTFILSCLVTQFQSRTEWAQIGTMINYGLSGVFIAVGHLPKSRNLRSRAGQSPRSPSLPTYCTGSATRHNASCNAAQELAVSLYGYWWRPFFTNGWKVASQSEERGHVLES